VAQVRVQAEEVARAKDLDDHAVTTATAIDLDLAFLDQVDALQGLALAQEEPAWLRPEDSSGPGPLHELVAVEDERVHRDAELLG